LINLTNTIVFNISINSSTFNLSGVNLTIYNTTFNSSAIVYSQRCTDTANCYFSYLPTAEGTRYDCILEVNVTDGTNTTTYTIRRMFVTRTSEHLASESHFDPGLSYLWIFFWFLLSAGVTAITYRFLGAGSLFVFAFMLIFGSYLGFFNIFSFPALFLIFIFIIIMLYYGG
jgi:hypothetical protein